MRPKSDSAVDHRRHGLDQAGGRVRFHQFHQVHERFAAHDAVGVAHHEIAVAAAPGVEKIAHVPAFAAFVVQPAAVMNAAQRVEFANQIKPAPFLLNPFVGIGGVAQDEKVEAFMLPGSFERFIRCAQTFADAHDVFVVDREDNGRADAGDASARDMPSAA